MSIDREQNATPWPGQESRSNCSAWSYKGFPHSKNVMSTEVMAVLTVPKKYSTVFLLIKLLLLITLKLTRVLTCVLKSPWLSFLAKKKTKEEKPQNSTKKIYSNFRGCKDANWAILEQPGRDNG